MTTAGSLCSGYGGLDLAAAAVLPMRLVWVSEVDGDANRVLAVRFGEVPNVGDLRSACPEPVDVVTAGFPCQPVSVSGKRSGVDDERWLWDDIAAFVGRMVPRPRLLLFENVAGLLSANDGDAMARVVSGLADLGYVGSWRVVRASDVGAPHQRARVFIVAHFADAGSAGFGELAGRAFAEEAGTDGGDVVDGDGSRPVVWGVYEPAVRRWERIIGRPSPPPTVAYANRVRSSRTRPGSAVTERTPDRIGRGGTASLPFEEETGWRLNPRFVEWMMGLPAGWVTDIGISHTAQLRILGNGVVPQQAAHAFRGLLV